MDYVFVDTGVFESNNFLDSKEIQSLLKLAEEGELTIVLPKITYNEILSRARGHIRASVEQFNRSKNLMRVIRNVPARLPLFDKVRAETVIDEFTQEFAQRLTRAKYLEVDYPVINITEIFTAYFEGTRPFGKANKKHEFPDAFALATIEKWCIENDRKCFVFSTDTDLLTYVSPHLEVVLDYKKFLEEKRQLVAKRIIALAEFTAIREEGLMMETAVSYVSIREEDIAAALRDWVTENLNDERRYTDVVNYHDVIAIDIQKIAISLNPPELLSVEGEFVEMELQAEVRFAVDVEIPDESTGWFDSEEREWHYFDNTTVNIERELTIPLLVSVETSFEDDRAEAYKFFLTEVNNGQDLEIREERSRRY